MSGKAQEPPFYLQNIILKGIENSDGIPLFDIRLVPTRNRRIFFVTLAVELEKSQAEYIIPFRMEDLSMDQLPTFFYELSEFIFGADKNPDTFADVVSFIFAKSGELTLELKNFDDKYTLTLELQFGAYRSKLNIPGHVIKKIEDDFLKILEKQPL